MNYLITKTKKTKEAPSTYKIVIEDKSMFEVPVSLVNYKEYSSDYKLETGEGEEEWFAVDEFKSKEYAIDIIKDGFNGTSYSKVDKTDFGNLEFLCSIEGDYYFFQKLNKASFVTKRIIDFNKLTISEKAPVIAISNWADAIYCVSEDRLYFKSLNTITTIFEGIMVLYREATEAETEDFLKNDFIELKGDFNKDNVNVPNKKRITQAMETLNNLKPAQKKTMNKYILKYCEDLTFDLVNSKFEIATNEQLKKLLWGIEQRYFTTIISKEKKVANSFANVEK